MNKTLTVRQAQVFNFVEKYQQEQGRAPTLKEICNNFGFRSVSSARDHLDLIEQKGFITRTANCSRSIRIIRQESNFQLAPSISVPLIGRIAAGAPSFALEEAEDILQLPKSLFPERKLFALRVQGDSMIKAGIFDGDIAVLKSQPDFTDGNIAAVVVDEEATLKRLYRTAKGLRLKPENDAYTDRIISLNHANRSCRVAGVLVGTIRQF